MKALGRITLAEALTARGESYNISKSYFSFYSPPYKQQKAEHEGIILRQLGHLGLLRPAAFRPFLTEGLALSGSSN
jgi:hypothetical protein